MYNETPDDLARKYSRTFLMYENKLAYVESFEGLNEGISASLKFSGERVWKHILWDQSKCIELQPDATLFNHGTLGQTGTSLLLLYQRAGSRQYRRSLCPDNTILMNPANDLFRKLKYVINASFSFDLINSLMNPKYPTIKEAVNNLNHNYAIAISPQYGLTLSPLNENYLIISFFGYIGEMTKKEAIIYHQPSYQEFTDFLKRTNQNIPVCLNQVN